MESVPVLNVESKVDMEVLMMIVMEDTVRLPGLPPQFLALIPINSYTFQSYNYFFTLKLIPEWSIIP